MAHEIKNPLTPIRLTLDRIEERTGGQGISDDELRKFLGRINAQVDMLERLVDQFRSFSREPEVCLAQVDCGAIIRSVAESMGQKITTTVKGEAALRSDQYLLQQIVLNLWKNALEAGAANITADIAATEEIVTITIRDDGPGIPPEHLERIWLPYVTFKKNGTGLGLPVVKQLTETLGGRITLASPRGGGVTVTLTFPSSAAREQQ
jgi:two-component system nitrogen regulation sensor histidine kinase NtrY